MVVFGLITGAALIVAIGLGLRTQGQSFWGLPASGWLGGVMVVASFFALPWIVSGPPGTWEQNTAWLASKADIVGYMQKTPVLRDHKISGSSPSAEDVSHLLEHPIKNELLDLAANQGTILGLPLVRLISRVEPFFALVLLVGLAAACLGVGLSFARLLSGKFIGPAFSKYLSATALAVLLLTLSYLPVIDTFGKVDHLKVRLLAVILELCTGPAVWFYMLGLVLLIVASIPDWSGIGPQTESLESQEGSFGY